MHVARWILLIFLGFYPEVCPDERGGLPLASGWDASLLRARPQFAAMLSASSILNNLPGDKSTIRKYVTAAATTACVVSTRRRPRGARRALSHS